jgi:hypothetical protein
MSICNGFKLRALNADCNRIAVKSSVQKTWMMTYKRGMLAQNKPQEVGMARDELVVIAFQDGSGGAEIEITPLGDSVGTLIAQSSRKGTKTLRVGSTTRYELDPGESVVLRTNRIVHPTSAGAGMAV